MNTSLTERIRFFENLFDSLCSTNSLSEKRFYVDNIPSSYKDDFNYIVECLNGKHIFGFKYYILSDTMIHNVKWHGGESCTIKDLLVYLQEPIKQHDLSNDNIRYHIEQTALFGDFLIDIVNRTLKLGIGMSLFEKDSLSPMLAKKYEGKIKPSKEYYITEKLDGNRCIAKYDNGEWTFTSRNGKPMYVNFDMTNLPKDLVYDGEVMSMEQTVNSITRYGSILSGEKANIDVKQLFNETSGIINSHSVSTNLVYNIFDIITDSPYSERRALLNSLKPFSKNVRILPVIKVYHGSIDDNIYKLRDDIVATGGEGLMINIAEDVYQNKRTDSLLKFKPSYSVDLMVIDILPGTGKYEGLVGALVCKGITDKGETIYCDVGSGLSDMSREEWAYNPEDIVGKIVEVEYFSMSQSKEFIGTNTYSLRFPRLKRVRYDKNTTSAF